MGHSGTRDATNKEMSSANAAYFEFIDFIAAGTTPEKVTEFRPSAKAQQRVEELIAKERDEQPSSDEQSELDYFLQLEHILRVAKARAEQILTRAS
jgi:hypothetical protein